MRSRASGKGVGRTLDETKQREGWAAAVVVGLGTRASAWPSGVRWRETMEEQREVER